MERRRGKRQRHTLLPLRSSLLSYTISCYYFDFKISALNQPLFRFGQRYSRWLRKWFSAGVGFSLAALIGVTAIGVWEVARAVFGYGQSTGFSSQWSALVFGFSPRVFGLGIFFSDFLYIFFLTLIAVSVYELGHAVAAASEGIQMEYISVFLAVLFPGALVAFNSEVMQVMHKSISLRVYGAGIWHNSLCFAISALIFFLLPLLLFPRHAHAENPVVLDVSSLSTLFGYLSPGDVIVSLDGMRIHREREWIDVIAAMDEHLKQYSPLNSSGDYKPMTVHNIRKGYCLPRHLTLQDEEGYMSSTTSGCPGELTEFVEIGCFEPTDFNNSLEGRTCLSGMDVVKLPKFGKAWMTDNS